MKIKNPIPDTPESWLEEISRAYLDAFDTIPFGGLIGQKIEQKDLFHLAPAICLRFRGLKQSKNILKRATDAALSSFVATENNVGDEFEIPQISFAFCYLASHYGLELVDEDLVSEVMDFIEQQQDYLSEITKQVAET